MTYPTELELLEFFESEPAIDDDVRICQYKDGSRVQLILSYNPFEDWAKSQVLVSGNVVAAVLVEGLKELRIRSNELTARFSVADQETELRVRLKPAISVEWNTLIKYR